MSLKVYLCAEIKDRVKGKPLDRCKKFCYSYEHKSSCELYLHIICGCFLCLSINEESGQSSNNVSREMYVRGKCKNKSRRNGNEKCKLERIIH